MQSSKSIKFSRGEWLILLILAGIQFANIIDFVLMIPLAPTIKVRFDILSGEFSQLVAAYGVSAAIAAILSASIIDRFDRKAVLVTLLLGFSLSTAACGLSDTYSRMLASRIAAGAFGGVLGSCVMTIIGDLFADARRGTAMGIIMSGFAAASVIGIPTGLKLSEEFGMGAPFLTLAVLVLLLTCLVMVKFPSLRGHIIPGKIDPFIQFGHVICNKYYLLAFLFSATVVGGGFLVIPFLADYMVNNVKRPPEQVKYVYLIAGCCTLFTTNIIGRLSDKIGKKQVFYVVAVCAAIMSLILTHLPEVGMFTIFLVTTCFMIFTSGRMVPAQALITGVAKPHERGAFMSFNSAVQHMTMGLASVVSGQFITDGPTKELIGYGTVGFMSAGVAMLSIGLVRILRSAVTPHPVKQTVPPEVVEVTV